jgi:formylglycine-generating enzyme required for sulfatase activity
VLALGAFVAIGAIVAGIALASRRPDAAASPLPEAPRSPAPSSRPGASPRSPSPAALPAWFTAIPESARPRLPRGLRPGTAPGEYEGPRGDVFVYVPGGKVIVGRADDPSAQFPNDHPIRPVELSPYFLGKYEVSVDRWRRFVQEEHHETLAERLRREHKHEPENYGLDDEGWPGPKQLDVGLDKAGSTHIAHLRRPDADWKHPHGAGRGDARSDDPVTQIDWFDACAYAHWAGARLPSDAEWEGAANGGGDEPRLYPWGSDEDLGRSNCFDASSVKHPLEPVTSRPEGAAKCGAHHMSGNAVEFVLDAYFPPYTLGTPRGEPVPRDPCYLDTESNHRVAKGGCVWDDFRVVRCDSRIQLKGSDDATGFRLAMSAAGTERPWEETPR